MSTSRRELSQWAGVSALAFTVVLWGMSGVAIKATSTTGIVTALYRTWFAIPLLWATMLIPSLRQRLNADWFRASLVGGSLFCFHQVLFFSSLKLTTVANVTIIGALQPILVLLVALPLFGERIAANAIFWSSIAFVGTLAVVIGAAHAPTWSPIGDSLAMVNLFAFTAYFLASKQFRTRVGAWEYVVGMTTVSGLGMLAVALATDQDLGSPHGIDWIILPAIAVFPGSLGHALANWAHAHVSAFVASMILLAVPVIAAAGAWLVLGERISALQVGGGVVVLTAVGMIVLSAKRPERAVLAESAAEADAP